MIDSYILAGYSYKSVWSTRKVVPTYSGPCMRVRRSSDNTEKDIYFTGDDLDTASILSFCGANSGYVTIWYDQAYQLVKKNLMKFSSIDLNVGTFRYWTNNTGASSLVAAEVAPDGTLTATRQTFTTTTGTAVVYTSAFSVEVNTDYTFSIYAKVGTSTEFALRVANATQTVTLGQQFFTLTGSWVRYSITVNTGAYNSVVCVIRNGNVSTGNMALWGGQFEKGSVMTEFEPTSFKALSGFDLVGAGSPPPVICNAGVINLVNSKPALYFNGTNTYFTYFQFYGIFSRSDFYLKPIDPNSTSEDSWSTYVVTKPTRLSHTGVQTVYASDYNPTRVGQFIYIGTTNTVSSAAFGTGDVYLGATTFAGPITSNNQIMSSYRTRDNITVYVNGVASVPFATVSSTSSTGYLGVGCRIRNAGNTEFYQGYIQEIVHYCGNLESTRTDFEQSARTYYSI